MLVSKRRGLFTDPFVPSFGICLNVNPRHLPATGYRRVIQPWIVERRYTRTVAIYKREIIPNDANITEFSCARNFAAAIHNNTMYMLQPMCYLRTKGLLLLEFENTNRTRAVWKSLDFISRTELASSELHIKLDTNVRTNKIIKGGTPRSTFTDLFLLLYNSTIFLTQWRNAMCTDWRVWANCVIKIELVKVSWNL